MFNFFKNKSDLEKLIDKDGLDYVAKRFAEIISRKLPTREIAYQFIQEELDGASGGNDASKIFAATSGINPREYADALKNSIPEVDGPAGPQQLLLALSLQLQHDRDLMAKFRCKVDEHIMAAFKFGKFSSVESRVADLLKSLRELMLDDSKVVPALTKNIPAPPAARTRHVYYSEKNIAAAQDIIKLLADITGKDNDALIKQAFLA